MFDFVCIIMFLSNIKPQIYIESQYLAKKVNWDQLGEKINLNCFNKIPVGVFAPP